MYAVACECVEEHGQGGYKGLTLTCRHLGNLTLMEGNTAKHLHVVMYHLPLQVVAACCPMVMVDGVVAIDCDEVVLRIGSQLTVEVSGSNHGLLVLCESTCGVFHYAESHRHNVVERLLVNFESLFLQFVNLVEDAFALVDRRVFNLCLQFGNLVFLFLRRLLNILLYLLSLDS